MSCVLALECAICMEDMAIKDLNYTPCSHAFHIKCITEWLERSKMCPQCRQCLSVNQLRRLYINVDTVDLNLEDISKLSYNVNYLKSQLVKKDNQIVGLKSTLKKYKSDSASDQQTIRKVSKQLEDELEAYKRKTTSNQQMIMERAKEQEKKEREANAVITALRKELETMATKLKSEHSLNIQLNEDLRALKIEVQTQEQKIKSLEKLVPPIAKPIKVKKSKSKPAMYVKKTAKIKVESSSSESHESSSSESSRSESNESKPIASRTRSRTVAKK